MGKSRKQRRLVLAGITVAILAVIFAMRGNRREVASSSAVNAVRQIASDGAGERSSGMPSQRESRGKDRAAGPSHGDSVRTARIKDEAQRFMTEIEARRAKVFSQYEDADGNSASTMLLERPTGQELAGIFSEYLQSLPADERGFVEDTGLSSEFKRDLADFFDYSSRYRYVTFLLAGDGSRSLPSALVVESEVLYDSKDAMDGVPATELRLREFMDLKEDDSSHERYRRLFSLK